MAVLLIAEIDASDGKIITSMKQVPRLLCYPQKQTASDSPSDLSLGPLLKPHSILKFDTV